MTQSFKDALESLYSAPVYAPRGLATKELLGVSYTVKAGDEYVQHRARKLSMKYIEAELAWYKKGNRWDTSITEHAKMWQTCIAKDGGINSNYGQYLFGRDGQLQRVIQQLKQDPDSRRAVAMILGQHRLHFAGIDTPCTMSMQFLLRAGAVHCIVTMRSQDAIWGAGNDTPFFGYVRDYVAKALGATPGDLTVFAGSFHVYERHFGMLEEIACDDTDDWIDYKKV